MKPIPTSKIKNTKSTIKIHRYALKNPGNNNQIQNTEDKSIILSANESNHLPNDESCFNILAIFPSRKSVIPARAKKIPKTKFCLKIANTQRRGIRINLIKVIQLDIFLSSFMIKVGRHSQD